MNSAEAQIDSYEAGRIADIGLLSELMYDRKEDHHRKSRKILSPSMLKSWKIARPWLLGHLQELLAAGWTRSALFRAGTLKFPLGPWGIAFLPTWLKPDVGVEIETDGTIRWTWTDANGRTVTQAARPQISKIENNRRKQ